MDALAARGIKETADSKYIFSRDLKERVTSLYGYPTDVIKEFAQKIKCPHLIVKATRHPERWKVEEEAVNVIRNVYRESNPGNYVEETVEGNHAIHLTDPDKVWLKIEAFLANYPQQHKL